MKFKLKVYSIYELGQRANQEDNMFPKHQCATDEDRLFIVCDGMGGHSAGEVASSLVCEAMGRSIMASCKDPEGSFTDADFKDALSDAYDALDRNDDGAVKKMGTTMTFLKFHKDGATVAHIGDSRVYHIRPSADMEGTRILFQTSDHSLVNDLVKIGEMTPEEAKVSKQKNVITRAMQPSMERRPSADIRHIDDIRPGDFFFMCTDGILENMEDENIRFIFSDAAGDDQTKVGIIIRATDDNKDNHSAYMIRVVDVGDVPVPAADPVDHEDMKHDDADTPAVTFEEDRHLDNDPEIKKSRKLNKVLLFASTLVLVTVLFFLFSGVFDKPESPKKGAEKTAVSENPGAVSENPGVVTGDSGATSENHEVVAGESDGTPTDGTPTDGTPTDGTPTDGTTGADDIAEDETAQEAAHEAAQEKVAAQTNEQTPAAQTEQTGQTEQTEQPAE